MNEQAIQTMYQLAQAEGYNNSIDDFIALMGSNPEAVQAMYNIAKTEGYNNSIEDFSTLMGVKKKEDTLVSESPLETASTESTSAAAPQPQQELGDTDSTTVEPVEPKQEDVTLPLPGSDDFLFYNFNLPQEEVAARAAITGEQPEMPQDFEIPTGLTPVATRGRESEIAVADQFESLTGTDVYRKILQADRAESLLSVSGDELDKADLAAAANGDVFYQSAELDLQLTETGDFEADFLAQLDAERVLKQKRKDSQFDLASIEDEFVEVIVGASSAGLEEAEFNKVKDLKEQYTQVLPKEYRENVEKLDIQGFAALVIRNKQDRSWASAAIGMGGLTEDELNAKMGEGMGARDAIKELQSMDLTSPAWNRFTLPWTKFVSNSLDGIQFAKGKQEEAVEANQRDKELTELALDIKRSGREATDEELERLGSVMYGTDYSGLKSLMGGVTVPSTNNRNAASVRRRVGKEMLGMDESSWMAVLDEVNYGEAVTTRAAYDYNRGTSHRAGLTELIDRGIMSKEDYDKPATQLFGEGKVSEGLWKTWGLFSDVLPDLTKAVGTTAGVTYLTGNPTAGLAAAAGLFGIQSGGDAAGEYASRPGITGEEALSVGAKVGAIEAGMTFAFGGMERALATGLLKNLGKEITEETGEAVARSAWSRFTDTAFGQTVKRVGAESTEELFIAAGDQIVRVHNEVASGRMTLAEAKERYYNPYAIGDAALGGALGGGAGSTPMVLSRGFSAIGSKFTMFDRIRFNVRNIELRTELADENTSPERKNAIRAELAKLAEDANRLERRDMEFYEQMSESDQQRLVQLNQEISRLRMIRKREDPSDAERAEAAASVRTLMEEKLGIENKYDAANEGFDLDTHSATRNESETQRLVDEVLSTDKQFDKRGLGVPGVKQLAGKLSLSKEGVEGMLSRVLAENITSTKFATAEQIRDGIVNAFNLAKAIIEENPDAEVVLVNSIAGLRRESGDPTRKVSRGVHVSVTRKGDPSSTAPSKIILYVPALKANTAYHEGFHQLVYRALGGDKDAAMIRLSSAIRRGMPKLLLARYNNLLSQYKNLSEAELAEEFLAEVYADMANGTIGVEYHKGVISGAVKFLNEFLVAKGIKIKTSPTILDVMSMVEDAAALMGRGETGSGKLISEALEGAKSLRPGYLTREGRTSNRELRRVRKRAAESAATSVSETESSVRAQALDPETIEVVSHNKGNRAQVAREIAADYTDAIQAHKAAGTGVELQLSQVTREQAESMLEDGATFLRADGVIAYVDKDGYAGGLIKNPNSSATGVIRGVTRKWLENGATHLEAYATFLEPAYMKEGFVPVARLKFDENLAPEGWDAENSPLKGRPDLVTFAYDPIAAALAKPGDGQYMSEYVDALNEARDRGARILNPKIKEQATLFNEDDAKAIKENDGQVIGSFYELLAKRSEEGDGAVYRYRGFLAGMMQGRMIFIDDQIPTTPEGAADRHVEFVFRPVDEKKKIIKLDEWFVNKAMDDEGNLIKGKENRGSGLGTRFLTLAMEIADELGIDVELMAYPTRNYQGTERQNMAASKKLVKYYQKFGFVERYKNGESMVRTAKNNLDQLDAEETQATQDLAKGVKSQAIEATLQFKTDTGRNWKVRREFSDEKHIQNFINYIEKKKGYTLDERWTHPAPPDVDPEYVERPDVKSQEIAVDMISQEVPSDMTRSIQVARVMNTWADSPVSIDENAMIERFLNNVYEEAGFYMLNRKADSSGITWYKEDIESAKKKLAIIYPEFNTEEMQSVAMALLAVLSPGNSPNGNMTTLAAVLNSTSADQIPRGNFARNWGGDKQSFVDKKGKSLASGRIVKETKSHFYVQGVDALGKDSKYRSGKNFLVKIAKNSLKEGYPKPTGFTQRGKVVATQLDKLESVFKDFVTPKAVIDFLKSDQPIATLRKYNPRVPDTAGKVNKNPAPGRRKGAYIFGEKVGSFFLNLEGMGESLTADLWFNRTWNRYMGTMIEGVVGSETIVEVPRSEAERKIMARAVKEAAQTLGLEVSEMQAVMWYFEQELWRSMGMNTRSENYNNAIDEVASRLELDDATRQRLSEAGVNLDPAEKRKALAVSRADAQGVSRYVERQEPGTKVKAQPIDALPNPGETPNATWKMLSDAGILLHGTPESFAEFDDAKAFRPNMPGLHGLGTYLTGNVKKAAAYGENVVYIDSSGLRLANMYNFRMGAVVTETLNSINRGDAESSVAIKEIARNTRRSRFQRTGKSLGLESIIARSPETFVEMVITETANAMRDANVQLGSGQTTIATLQKLMYGDEGFESPAVQALVRFSMMINSTESDDARFTSSPESRASSLLTGTDMSEAILVARMAFVEIIRRSGFDGYYFSNMMDYSYQSFAATAKSGFDMPLALEQEIGNTTKAHATDSSLEMAGLNVGSGRTGIQEAVIVNTERLNDLIIPADKVIEAAQSRMQGEEGTTKAQIVEGLIDDQAKENEEFIASIDRPVPVTNPEQLGRTSRILLDLQEFFQDKFAKVLYVQRAIEKGRGRRVFREQDYDMALALMDGRAAGKIKSVDAFMQDVAKSLRINKISLDDIGQFLYAMHAPNRNAVLDSRKKSELKNIEQKLSDMQEQLKVKGMEVGAKRKLAKQRKELQQEYDRIQRQIEEGNFSGMTNEEAAKIVSDLDSEGMRMLYNKIMDFQSETRRLIVEYGFETQQTINALESTFPSYVPLSGFAVDESLDAGYTHMHQARVFSEMKRAEGRQTEAANPLDMIFARRYQTVMVGEKNRANVRLLNLLASNPQPDLYKIYGPKDKAPMSESKMRSADSPFVEVVVGAKSFFIEFANEGMARAVNGQNVLTVGDNKAVQRIYQFIRTFGRFMSASFTSYSPDFMGANFVRDIQTGVMSLMAEQEIVGGQAFGVNIVGDAVKGVRPAFSYLAKTVVGQVDTSSDPLSKYWQEYQDEGAITEWPYQRSPDQYKDDIDVIVRMSNKEQSAAITAKRAVAALDRYVGGTNQAIENATRFSVFVAARKAGIDAEQAAFLAKELTVNFNRSGAGGSVVNSLYLFFNAGVQGTAKFYRTLSSLQQIPDGRGGYYKRLNSAQKAAAGMTMFAFFQAALNDAFGPEDDDGRTFYEKIPDYVKERNMLFVNPFAKKPKGRKAKWEDYYFKVPLPYGYNIFHNMGAATYDVTMDYRSPGNAAMFMTSGVVNSFVPVSFGQSSSFDKQTYKALTPTMARPFTEVVINENYFGTQVYKEPFPGEEVADALLSKRGPEWWKDTFKFINEATGGNEFESGALDVNPDKLWHIGAYWTGGTGKFIDRTANIGRAAMGYDDDRDWNPNDFPLVRVFLGSHSEFQDMADYYKFRSDVNAKAKAVKEGVVGQDTKGYESVNVLKDIGFKVDKQLRQVRKDLEYAKKNMEEPRRTREINDLEESRRMLLLNYNKQYLKYVKGRTDLD